ncbi:MAG: hypothetical protein M3N93_03425 [Acidobacteriota bacterium]|nr:hypothetical protein [Acidobacteriota bacterium]
MVRNRPCPTVTLFLLAAIPFIAQAYEYGPDPRYTGAPGDNKTACVSSGCHQGVVNSGTGGVRIVLPNGTTYTPGQSMKLSVQITDAAKVKFGFEMTARLASNTSNGQAGDFTAGADGYTQVICDVFGAVKANGSLCPTQNPVQFIEHTNSGYEASTKGGYTFTFTWTPPASGAGNVILYAAANAGPGDPAVSSPTNVYTTNVTLTPGAASPAPVISNALNAATGQTTLAASTYAAIYGSGLSTTNPGRIWTAADFVANGNGTFKMPTSLDGTTVTVGGVPAYIEYVSPTQLNIVTPAAAGTGNGVPVVVSLNGQPSAVFSVTLQNLAPSFFAWSPATADAGKYLIAQHADYSNIGKVGLFPGTPASFTTPAKPGETILLYGTGFGPTSPPIAAGIETDKVYNLSPTPTATLGSIAATVAFAGLIPPESEVYQFDIVVPASAPAGDLPLVVNVNGTLSYLGLITVHQ